MTPYETVYPFIRAHFMDAWCLRAADPGATCGTERLDYIFYRRQGLVCDDVAIVSSLPPMSDHSFLTGRFRFIEDAVHEIAVASDAKHHAAVVELFRSYIRKLEIRRSVFYGVTILAALVALVIPFFRSAAASVLCIHTLCVMLVGISWWVTDKLLPRRRRTVQSYLNTLIREFGVRTTH